MNTDLAVVATGQRMSSREIAELTEKNHKDVLRDIRNLQDQGVITGRNFALSTYTDASGKSNPKYLLDFDATMTLVTGYNAVLRAKVIRRWRELEEGTAKPIPQAPAPPLLPAEIAQRELEAARKMAEMFGFEGNQALLRADKVVRKLHNLSPLALLEVDLKALDNEALFIATEIGRRLEPELSARNVNRVLTQMKFMERRERAEGKYENYITEKGKKYGLYVDVGKNHSDGAPIRQIKWKESILPIISNYLADSP